MWYISEGELDPGLFYLIIFPPHVMEAWHLGSEDALRLGDSDRQVDTLNGRISHHLVGDPAYFTFDTYSAPGYYISRAVQSRGGMSGSVFVNPMRESIEFEVFVELWSLGW